MQYYLCGIIMYYVVIIIIKYTFWIQNYICIVYNLYISIGIDIFSTIYTV